MASLMQYLVAAWVMLTTPRRLYWMYSFRGIVEFMVEHELSSLECFAVMIIISTALQIVIKT